MSWKPLDYGALTKKPILARTRHGDPVVVASDHTLAEYKTVLFSHDDTIEELVSFGTQYSKDRRIHDYEAGYVLGWADLVEYMEIPE